MLDINLIRNNPDFVKEGIAKKNVDPQLVDDFLSLDARWRELTKQGDDLRAELNRLSKERKIEEARGVKQKIKDMETEAKTVEAERLKALKLIPNLPLPEVPVGKDEKENVVVREGKKPDFGFPAKDYMALAQLHNLIDTERAAKVSGSRFGYLKNEAALLEIALVRLAMDFLTSEKNIKKIIKENKLDLPTMPFIPVIPPALVKPEAMEGMGYVERGGEEIYKIEKDNLYLIGTSEQSIGPMHMDEMFEEKDLPRRYVGFSPCFRREAGSYGRDTKGILRVHQFDKVEMFSITTPEQSADEHKLLLALEEALMQELGLPYRVLNICSGDLGDPAAAKYDIEAWLPGQPSTGSGPGETGEYRETHSTSNTTDYQARRLNICYKSNVKSKMSDVNYVHMLNGTMFAIGRMIIAILENGQQEDGSIKIPKVLASLVGKKVIGKK